MVIGRTLALALVIASGCEETPRTYSTKSERGTQIFADDFNRDALGDQWLPTGEGFVVEDGRLRLEGLHNHPIWLRRELPDDVRVDFDAWALAEPDEPVEGDIKVELCGDGRSLAKTVSYKPTGYVVIFGGWSNSLNKIARKDEHGTDEVSVRHPKVEAGKRYRFTITRKHGVLRWEIDGNEILTYEDPQPLTGPGQNSFAFNNWEAPTVFDNLVIEEL